MNWKWENFTLKELSCKHCGESYIDEYSLDALQDLRDEWGKPIVLTSAHRCIEHNKAVGGAPRSYHLRLAFDCVCPKEEQEAFAKLAKEVGFHGIIQYRNRGFVHLDCRPDYYEKIIK